MESAEISLALSRFVEQLSDAHDGSVRALRVSDLLLGIRDARLSEESDRSSQELDALEAHAARFAWDAPLESVLSEAPQGGDASYAAASTPHSSPSPFAWM